MHIEIPLTTDHYHKEASRKRLHEELRKWAHTHNISQWSVKTHINRDNNSETVFLSTDRQYELFCISWNPTLDEHKKFHLRR